MKSVSVLSALPALTAVTLLASGAATASDDLHRVNGAVSVAEGQHTGDVSTVNGSVNIGANAVVGVAHTVNGSVHLGHGAAATSVSTVNGSIHVAEQARINGEAHSVNGGLSLDEGSSAGELVNVNGGIHVSGAHIGGRIDTVNGDIDIGRGSHVDGDIVVERTSGWQWNEHVPRVVIGPESVVKGVLRFKRKVRLLVSDRATIGSVEGATPQRFSGDHPPQD